MLALGLLLVAQIAVTPEDYGAVGDCVTPDDDAFEAMLEDVCAAPHHRLIVIDSCYQFTAPLTISCPVRITGALGFLGFSMFEFPANTSGIIFAPGSHFSTLEHVQIHGAFGTNDDAHGITIKDAAISVRDLKVNDFSGNGIDINCDLGMGTACSTIHLSRLRIEQMKNWGLRVRGGDANGNTYVALDLSDNLKGCVFDDSFLGSTYDGGHCDSSQQYSQGAKAFVQTNPNASVLISGMHFEGPPPIELGSISAVVQGGNGWLASGGMVFAGGKIKGAKWEGKFAHNSPAAGDHIFEFTNYRNPNWPMFLDYEFNGDTYSYAWQLANSGAFMRVSDYNHPTLAPGQVTLPNGAYLGAALGKVTAATSVPTGSCKKGDFRFYTHPEEIGDPGSGCWAYYCKVSTLTWKCLPVPP